MVRLLQFTTPIVFWKSGILSSFGKKQNKLVLLQLFESEASISLNIQVFLIVDYFY